MGGFRRLLRRSCLFASIMVVAGAAAIGTSFAASLLKPAVASASQQKAADKLSKRQRMVSLDLSILATQIHPATKDQAADRAANSERLEGRVTVDLFDGLSVTLARRDVEASDESGVIWQATAPNDGYGIFVINNNKLVGVIETAGRSFMIEPAGPGLHLLREVDVSAYPKDRHIERPALKSGHAPAPDLAPSRGAITYFNLLVAYTSRARTEMISGGATLAQVIDLDISIVNRGMINSSIPVRIRRAGLIAVNSSYNENTPSNVVQPLFDITYGTNANFPAIRSRRTAVAADLVALYIDRTPTPYCGVAWVNYPVPSEAYGFAGVDANCRGSVTLAHELGHNMGLYHDRYVHDAAPASQYDFGYVNTSATGNFRTIMSYSDKCYAVLGHDCPTITYFSTPQKTYNGRPVGIAKGMTGAADAARWIREKKAIIAGFR